MKKVLALLTVLVTVNVFPLAAYADNGYHDWERRAHHESMWREHEREWREHDREWSEHQHDKHWRKVHAREWREWYRWHEADEKEFRLHISGDRFDLDIER